TPITRTQLLQRTNLGPGWTDLAMSADAENRGQWETWIYYYRETSILQTAGWEAALSLASEIYATPVATSHPGAKPLAHQRMHKD
ncbi:hypothetical protein LTR28_013769, partial [Elasticomyces elasticus]